MNEQQIRIAHNTAMEVFDRWNETTGAVPEGTSWYYEIESLIKDAVTIGGRVALGQSVSPEDFLTTA